MDRNIDRITGISDGVTITSESLMETTEFVSMTEPEGRAEAEGVTEPEGVDVKDTTQPKGVDVKAQLCKELPPKLSIKRKTLDKSCDGESQKDIPAGKRVLLSLPKRKYKWQGYKRPKKPQLYCSKKRQVSPEITKRSEDVSSHISEQSCERSVSCEQTETECVNRTDVKESVISESVVKKSASEIKQDSAVDDNLCANSSESMAVKVDISAPVNTSADVCDTEKELYQLHGSGTLDVSLRIDDDNTDSCQGAETGLHHLKMLTEELSQLGRDSATLVTARQGRIPKKRKQRLDEHVHSQQPVRRTSSPKRNVKQQANCDFSEVAFAEDLSSMASHPHDKKHDKCGDAGGSQGGASASKEMEIIDDTLEEKSKRFLLTAKNVRSIVHELVTNEQVLAMMCNTLQDDNINDQLNEAIYEPKMTRSKVKEVIEMGQLPSPWILSPIKGSKTDTNPEPHFLEMTFSEDEEDEEYKPTEDELMAYSDVGTPVPLPLTSQEEDTADMSALKSDDDSHSGACDTATIALRTRSKLPLQDTPLEQIELGFVAPDISADMYDTYCDDSDWKNFLFSIVKFDARQDVNDSLDDEADPEYNFLAEVEKEEIDVEDFRNDRDVRVTKKELNELMDEVFEAYGAGHDQPPNKKTAKDTAKTKRQKGNKESSSAETGPQLKFVGDLPSVKGAQSKADESKPKDTSAVPLVTDEEKIQIQDQMRKHVQLLTQTYVQAGSRPELTDLTDLARLFLMELKALGDKAKLPHGMTSFLNPPNLLAALEVVGQPLPHPDEMCNEDLKRLMVANFVPKNMYEVYGLNYEQMEVFMTSTVFMFPQMLPECCLLHCDHPGKKRVLFSQAEDNLLAMGIEQFGHLPNKYAFIEQYMLPTKKKQQLRYRLKNLKADRTTGENTIKYLSKHNQLPEFPRYLELEDLEDVVRPQDRDPDLLPVWCKAFLATRLNHESNCQTELTGVTGWVQVGSVAPPTASTPVVEKEETQEKKTPAAPSRKKSSKKVGVSGLNQFHKDESITASTSPPPPSEGSVTDSTVLVETVGEDAVVMPVSDSQENASVGTHTPSKVTPSVVINAAVLSPGSLLGGTSAVKMTTMLRPGFPAVSPVVSSPAVGIDEPLIMLTPRQLSQLGVKINMVPVGGDTKVQLSSPSGVDTLVSVASGGRRTPVLSSGPKIVEDQSMESGGDSLLSVALTGVTLSMSATTTKCSPSQLSPSPTADPSVTRLSQADSIPMGVNLMSGDTVNASHCVNVDMTDAAADVTGVDSHFHDDTVAANAVEQSVAASASLPVNSAVTVTTVDTVKKLVDTMTKPVDSSGNSDKSGISADVVVSSKIVPCVLAALTGSQNKTPEKMPGTPPQEKTSPCKCSLLYNSPSRKSTVFHRLQKPPEKTPPKAKKTISILPHPAPTLSMPDFSTGSPFYQSPSKQITFVQPPGGLSGFASTDTAVNRNLAFSLRSPSKNGSLAVNRRAVYISPVKKAAAKITARLKKVRKLRKLERILPKTVEASTVSTTDLGSPIVDTESCKVAGSRVGAVSDASLVRFSLDGLRENTGGDSKVIPLRPPTEAVTLREDAGGVESESDGESVKGVASRPESATEYEDDDNDDEDHLAQLMAASTTIRFAPKLPLSETDICLTKAKKKRAVLLELLVPDLVAKDPLRDERDTAFAQAYLTTAKEVLLSNNRADIYEQLLKLLHDFGQSDRSPVELYQQLRAVLADFPELVQEFIVFLLPEQAKECDCFMAHLECQHARTFLRKLEVHLRKHPSHLQKIINIFLQWQNSQATCDVSLLKEAIKPLLRGQQHLMEEFCWFFNDEQPPQSTLTEFEEVTLKDSDDNDALEEDSYEEVQLPEGDELLGSQWCKCQCHQSDVLLFHRRKRHCRACRSSGIKIIKGRIYVQTSESSLKPAHVVFHSPQESRGDPVPTDSHSTQPQAEANDDTVKVELSREDVERSASPAPGSSTRCPSEQAAVGQLPSLGMAPLAGSRPRTTTTVCVSAAVEVCRTDSRRVDCVQETVSDQAGCTGPQSAVDSVCHNPPVSGVLVGAVSETVSETLASADPGIGVTNCDDVVHCVEAERQTEASMSGASAQSLPICSWTKEEDKQILESCKQHGLGGSTFQTVAAALKKSADGVSKRFYELMQLFNEQPSDPSENDSDNESDGSPVG